MNDTYNQTIENVLTKHNSNIFIGKVNFMLTSFGLIGNTICLMIFSTKELRKSTFNKYLLILAIIELLFCLTVWANESCMIFCHVPKFLIQIDNILAVFIHLLTNLFHTSSIMITLLLSIDRLYAIYQPLKIKDFITRRNIKLSVFIGLLICFVVHVPELPLFLLTNELIYFTYSSIFAVILLATLPALIMLILNTILFIKIIHHDYRRRTRKDNFSIRTRVTKDENKIVNETVTMTKIINYQPLTRTQKSHFIVIIIIGMWLILTEIPYNLIIWIMLVTKEYQKYFVLQFITSVLWNSNHCINFFIYICFHNSFRAQLRRIIMSVVCPNRSNNSIPHSLNMVTSLRSSIAISPVFQRRSSSLANSSLYFKRNSYKF